MPTPPVTVPPGQEVVWVIASQVAFSAVGQPGHGTAEATLSTATLTQNAGSPILPPTETATWTEYPLTGPLSDPDVVIHNVYAVADVNGSINNTQTFLNVNGVNLSGVSFSGTFSGQMSRFVGTASSDITTAQIVAQMLQTIGGGYPVDTLNVTWVGLAVYIDIPAFSQNFQYPNGLPVANGYLLVSLSEDCKTADGKQLVAEMITRVPLNANGSATGFLPFVNADLTPNDSMYRISVYSSDGQLVRGPYSTVR